MRSVEFTKGKYATNNSGEGLFILIGGAYSQLVGNAQTPTFKTPEQFIAYIRRHGYKPGSVVRVNW